uniref:Pectinesterase n=1 Tax=Meloidogyne hapla TaxID=6305 RepID=A0A1I8BTX9_MELHA
MLVYYKFILFPILSLISQFGYCSSFTQKAEINQKQELIKIDPSNLDIYFFQVAVSALFKAKANFILRSLPHTERIVFRQCVINSEGKLNLLAKCMVSLFNVRDNFKEKGWRNLKFKENFKRNDFATNNEEIPLWTQLFKFNGLSKLKEHFLPSSSSRDPLMIFQPKKTKIKGNFTIFKILMEEHKGTKNKTNNVKPYQISIKEEKKSRISRMKQRSNRNRS